MRNPQDFKIRCSQIGKIMSNAKTKGELSQVCKTYLNEWYTGEEEEIRSKYIDKGNMVEDELIDFAVEQLGLGIASKNEQSRSDEYLTGSCDVDLPELIIDVKASWSVKTLHQAVTDGLDKDYEWQLRGYMHLYGKPKAVLFYGILDTPPEANYGKEIIYQDMPPSDRWVAYNVENDPARIEEVIERVKLCRIYLEGYDKLIKEGLGRCK